MKIAQQITELIGNTPLLELTEMVETRGIKARVVVKLESFNPGGSAKDRVGLAMIEEAERTGKLLAGGTIIEPTSGNTGVGLALAAAVKGYRLVLTMPETMSIERQKLLKAYGAKIVLTHGNEGMSGSIRMAQKLQSETPNSIILQQFENPSNAEIHRLTTGEEIWRDTDGLVDMFVAGVGTGGTISGVGQCLKSHNSNVKIVAAEPATSAVLSGHPAGAHKLQGIGAGFVPKIYDSSVVDEVVAVSDDDAMRASRELAQTEGVLVGISSGAALWAALYEASKPENEGKLIVALLPDTGERYLSTELFQ